MYVAIRDVMVHHAGYATMREALADLRLDAVELALSRDLSVLLPDATITDPRAILSSDEDVFRVREVYNDGGIHVSGLLLANNFNSEDPAAEIAWVVEAVRIAQGLGAEAVRVDAAMTGQQELPLRQRITIYADAVKRVLEATPEFEVPVAIENHGFQGNDPEWLQGVLEAVSSERVGLTLDTGNFYWAGQPLARVYEIIAQFAPHVKHTHCKNIAFEPGQREVQRQMGWGYGEHVCPIPDGDVDHRRIARMLWDAGYNGALNIEDESLGRYDAQERRLHLRRDADHLAEVAVSVGGSRAFRGPACCA